MQKLTETIKSSLHGRLDIALINKITPYVVKGLEEAGAIVPPCKVGAVVYFVGRNNGKPMGTIDELVIVGIEKTEQRFNAKAKFKDNENVFKILDFSIDNYGFFSTREAAKKHLRKNRTKGENNEKLHLNFQ